MHSLKPEHFDNMEKALEAADQLMAKQRLMIPCIAKDHPDQVVEGNPLVDQFWYVDWQGAAWQTLDQF